MNDMKRFLSIITILMATIFNCFAQDTITGVVNRITAPYFEQNVCDTRFAITTTSETYYVMVDNYWPNPYLEDLVIHYDTIAVGNEISVIGNILEMEDGNGEAFSVIDISQNLNSTYQQIFGFFSYRNISFPGPDTISVAYFCDCYGTVGYYICCNGELQINNPCIINGRALITNKRYLFIGNNEVWTNSNGNSFYVFNLVDALPYDVADISIDGILASGNDLCLTWPCNETSYLSLYNDEEYYYLTNKREFQDNYINDSLFMEGDSVVASGFESTHYDLFGANFKTMEIVKLQSKKEKILTGLVSGWGMPYTNLGMPIPGAYLALINGNNEHYEGYYIMKPNGGFYTDEDFYIVNNDTIHVTDQQISATFIPSIFIDNWIDPYYRISITNVDFNEHIETIRCTLAIVDNPLYFGNTLAVTTQDNDIYYLKPYIYTHTAPNHITIGNKTIYVGDRFWATGAISTWYDSNWGLHQVIDITSVEFDGIDESYSSEIQIYPNPSNGIIEIVSEQPIENISVYDCTGRVLVNKYCGFSQVSFDLNDYKGMAIIKTVLDNGNTILSKVIIE